MQSYSSFFGTFEVRDPYTGGWVCAVLHLRISLFCVTKAALQRLLLWQEQIHRILPPVSLCLKNLWFINISIGLPCYDVIKSTIKSAKITITVINVQNYKNSKYDKNYINNHQNWHNCQKLKTKISQKRQIDCQSVDQEGKKVKKRILSTSSFNI